MNLVVDRGALRMDLRVAADADVDRVGIIVRDTTTKAFQLFLDELQRQLGKRIRVRI